MGEYSNIIDRTFSSPQARSAVVGDSDVNPDDTARALELSRATGISPAIIGGDLNNFEKQHKAGLGAEIVASNPHLTDYVNRDPIHAKISNDDWGQLDTVSAKMQRMGMKSVFQTALDGFMKGFNEGYDVEGRDTERAKAFEHPLMRPLMANPVTGPIIGAFDTSMRTLQGGLYGVGEAFSQAAQSMGMSEAWARRGLRDVVGGLQVMMPEMVHPAGLIDTLAEAQRVRRLAAPYAESGKVPPVGLHPIFDEIHKQQSELDLKNFDEAFKEAQASKTRERNPDIFANFIRQHNDASIGISGEAVAKLYGEKVPHPDDGLLGFVPDLAQQLEEAKATGGDIHVPLADWLAKVDPEVHRELHDDIRVRPEGVTKNEAGELKANLAEPRDAESVQEAIDQAPRIPLGQLLKEGDMWSSPYITKEGEIISTGGDHYSLANVEERLQHGLVRIRFGPTDIEGKGPNALGVELVKGQTINPKQRAVLDRLNHKAEFYGDLTNHNDERVSSHKTIDDLIAAANDPHQSAVDSVRKAAGLTLAEGRDLRRLKMQKEDSYKYPTGEAVHTFALLDENAKDVGHLLLSEHEGGKKLYVEEIFTREGAQAFGPRAVRDLLHQIKTEFPNAETLEGVRVSGARAKVHEEVGGGFSPVAIKLAEESTWPKGWLEGMTPTFEAITSKGVREGGEPYGYRGQTAQPLFTHKLTDLLDEVQTPIRGAGTAVYTLLRSKFKEFLKDVEVVVLKQSDLDRLIQEEAPERVGKRTPGFYDPRTHKIVVSDDLMSGEWGRGVTNKVIFHEAAHAFTEQILLAEPDMKKAIRHIMNEVDASIKDALPDVRQKLNYGFTSESEFVAEAFSNPHFQELLAGTPISEGLARTLGLGEGRWTLWDAFRQVIKQVIERLVGYRLENSALDAMLKMGQYFEERQQEVLPYRQALKERYSAIRAAESQPELPGVTRMEDRDAFEKAAAIGMTVDQYGRYMKKIAERQKEDLAAATKRAVEDQRRRQTKEWKDNEREERAAAADEVNARPDVMAYNTFLETKTKIDPEFLTPEQKATLPKDFVGTGKDSVNPDDIAGLFGYASGADMVNHMVTYEQQRAAANMRPEEFKRRLIAQETEKRMQAKYGDLSQNILDEAKDQVLSETQLDLLHEETLALGLKAGTEFSITKEQMKAWVQKQFAETRISAIDSDQFLRNAGKAGRAAEEALLKDKFTDAFKAKQQQFIAVTMANEARKLEKARTSFERTAKRFSKREVAGFPTEYTNWIHDILGRVGQPVRRSLQDLQEAIGREAEPTLQEFVSGKQGMLRELPVADFLMDPNFRRKLEDLTADEFKAVKASVDTLVKNGRDEGKIIKAGEEADLKDVMEKMYKQLQEFREKHYNAEGKRVTAVTPGEAGRVLRTWGVNHLQMESIFNHMDKGDPRGVFTQYIFRPLVEGANYQSKLERDFAAKLRALKDDADLKENIPNGWLKNPDTGGFFTLNRKNLRAIMLNVGNESNLDKFARGYGVDKDTVRIWLWRHATKEDWDWAQGIWNMFKDVKDLSDRMYQSISGVPAENVRVEPIQTPHGVYDGGYYPVIWHPTFETKSRKLLGPDALEQDNYHRATTPNGYTVKRTNFAGPMALDLDMLPVRLRQMLHDIAMRPAVINASKVLYKPEFHKAVRRYWGKETADEIIPYLRDVANSSNFLDVNQSAMMRAMEVVRQNMIGTLIGWNPGTVMKHGATAAVNSMTEVGPMNFLKAAKGLLSVNEHTGDRNWSFAMKESEELQRRHQHYQETLFGVGDELTQAAGAMGSIRKALMYYQSKPVAFFDLLSAVPTWMAKYEAGMREGLSHGDAVFEADRAVRRAHGSMAITSQPGVVRKASPLARTFTSLYGFFNHVMNRQYEMTWQAADAAGLTKGSKADFMKFGNVVTVGLTSYVLLPALIEELVTPLPDDGKESFTKKAAKSLAFTLSASWIGLRDVVSAALRGQDPSAGLISTGYQAIHKLIRDFSKEDMFNKANRGKLIQDGVTLAGAVTGMFPSQLGKSGRFIHDVAVGKEHPKGPWGWLVGLRYGTLEHHSKTFDEWAKHLKGH